MKRKQRSSWRIWWRLRARIAESDSMSRFEEKPVRSFEGFTPRAALATALIFGLFLALFPLYAPFAEHPRHDGVLAVPFKLFFFVANQTLGMIHEAGHGVCYLLPCPQWVMIAMGTIFQLAFPLGVAWYFRRRGNAMGWWIGIFFTGFSLRYTAWYISTVDRGPRVSASESFLGVDGLHDFYYLLDSVGLREAYLPLSFGVTMLAYALMLWTVGGMFAQAFSMKKKR